MSRRALALLPALAVLAAPAALCAGCSPASPVEILEYDVSPTGRIARCQSVDVRFKASARTRYALTSGARTVAAGMTRGLREELTFTGDALAADATELRLTLAIDSGDGVEAAVPLSLDERNVAPVARPRLTGAPSPGAAVGLDASSSDDADGDPIESVAWRIVQGPPGAAIDPPTAASTMLTLPEGRARVVVELAVTDDSGAVGTSTLVVRPGGEPANMPPVFDAPDGFATVEAEPGDAIELEANATDPDDLTVTLDWRQVSGPPVALAVGPGGSTAQLTAPEQAALLAFEVVASDGTDEALLRIAVPVGTAVADAPPTPAITILDPIRLFEAVRLDGSGTSDPDSEDLLYEWSVRSAPVGSLLGDDAIRGRIGFGASQIEVNLDLPGTYEIELRASDALGRSPAVASVEVEAALEAEQVSSSAVADLDCSSQMVAWAGPDGVGIRELSGAITMLSDAQSRAVAITASDDIWFDATDHAGGTPSIGFSRGTSVEPDEILAVPEGSNQVNALGIDPAAVRTGDVYVGTDAGTAILDRSVTTCPDPTPLGCWVGSPSIGYLHQPPSRTGYTSISVDVLHVSSASDGTTVVHLGNEYWLVRLERGVEDQVFRQTAIDLFSDTVPQQITALTTSPGGVLYSGIQSLGLVRRDPDGECGYFASAPTPCTRAPLDECALAASATPPAAIADLAAWGEAIFVAADGVFHHDPALGRFARVGFGGAAPSGTPAALALCDGNLYVGTELGLWIVPLEVDR
jgi:hypothetical protein